MDVKIDYDSIKKKMENYVESSDGQKKISESVNNNGLGGPDEAAQKFISILHDTTAASVSSNVAAGIYDLTYSYTKTDSGQYVITIKYANDIRSSLNPDQYPNVRLAELYDQGVDHTMNPVYGYWHGNWIKSKQNIIGGHFIQSAKDRFLSEYKDKYNIASIEIYYEN